MIMSVTLTNWKSHLNTTLEFKEGTNVLVGAMGSGKSSILQAISFALFGTFSELKSRQLTQADLITRGIGAQFSEVSVKLSQQGKQYTITRKIDQKKHEAVVRDASGKMLAGPNTTNATEFVYNLLKIDEDLFLRTVYAMQNDIDMILKLTPKDRKKRIDELMGLTKFEKARDNCVTLRNKIGRSKTETEQFLSTLNVEEIATRIDTLRKEHGALKTKQASLKDDIKKRKVAYERQKTELDALRKQASAAGRLEERRDSLSRRVEEIQNRLSGKQLDKSKEQIEKELEELRSELFNFNTTKVELTTFLDHARSELLSHEKRIGVLEQKKSDVKDKLDKIQRVRAELAELKISDLNKELTSVRKKVDEKREAKQALMVELKSFRKHLEELERAESSCPICKTELTETSKLELINERKREVAEVLMDSSKASDKLNEVEKRKEELEQLFDKNRYMIEDIEKEDAFLVEYKEISEELNSLLSNKKLHEQVISDKEPKLKEAEKQIEEVQYKKSALTEDKHLYDLKDQLGKIKQEHAEAERQFILHKVPEEELESAESKFRDALRSVQEMETTEKGFGALINEKEERIKELAGQQAKIQDLQKKVAKQEQNLAFLDLLRNAIEAAQLSLRDELIMTVNEVMTTVWLEIYPYEKWNGVRLQATENDYVLQLKETERDWISVIGFASGGERMIASLAVRIAFARVLAPNLSLLILDEPTHNLDENAIKTLINVIHTRVEEFLDQIFIVTHEEKLSENADNVIRL